MNHKKHSNNSTFKRKRRPEGARSTEGARSEDSGFKRARSEDSGFKRKRRPEGARSEDSGFKRARSEDSGFKRARSEDSGFKRARSEDSGFKRKRRPEGARSTEGARSEDSGFKRARSEDSGFKRARSEDSGFKRKRRPEGARSTEGARSEDSGFKRKRRPHHTTSNNKKHPSKSMLLKGIIKRHSDGFGFVIPDDSSYQDIYVSSTQMNSALTNDYVEVFVNSRKKGGKIVNFGSIKKILKRHCEFAIGPYEIFRGKEIILDQNLGSNQKIEVSNPKKIPVKEGDWIKVKITSYPKIDAFSFRGDVVVNLGPITSDAKDDALRALAQYNISWNFPNEVLEEVEQIPDKIREEDLSDRKDLTNKSFVTIDGATAKDFDDAIFVEKQPFGFRLFVAIADVSYYVQKDSALDKEAYLRGNSSYFPYFVSPMLPKKLSDDLCSLKPDVQRLAFVAEMDFDFKGEMQKSTFYPAVIKSHKRFTYGEVQEILEGNLPIGNFTFLKEANELAKILIRQHKKNGALDLDIPEIVVNINEQGEPIDIMKTKRLFAHELIEQFMLASNKAVSAFLERKKFPVIYRIHEPPKTDNVKKLQLFSKKIGLASLQDRKNMVKFIGSIKEHAQESLFHILILRSLSQACYSATNKKHYGLNFDSYTHFTSPIRRYCDLEIHRLLKQALSGASPDMDVKQLESKAKSISAKEQASVKAERQVNDIKKARFLKIHLGKVFTGSISSITSFGMFITLKDFYIDGLVRFKDLSDHWKVDDVLLRAVAKKSKYVIDFGDNVEVQVLATNVLTGDIDFHLVKHKDKFINF